MRTNEHQSDIIRGHTAFLAEIKQKLNRNIHNFTLLRTKHVESNIIITQCQTQFKARAKESNLKRNSKEFISESKKVPENHNKS